jgi:two-component system sensor histidine kinase TctE
MILGQIRTSYRESLRLHLIGWLTIPLGTVALFMAWLTYANAELTAGLVTDRLLSASAQTIAEQIKVEDGAMLAPIPPSALGIFASGAGDRVIYRIMEPDGDLVAGLPGIRLPPTKVTNLAPVYYDTLFEARWYRAVAIAQPVAGWYNPAPDGSNDAIVIVASSTKERDAMTRSLWLQGVRPMGVLLALVVGLGWLGLDRGLRPLKQLRLAVADRSGSHLSPLGLDRVPTEVRPLVIAFNEALARVDRYIEAQRRFIANAAHQMRTPLTLLKMQVHYGLTEDGGAAKTEALSALDTGIDALMRLVAQLLILARAEPHTPIRADVKPVDMMALVSDVLVQLAPLALDRGIDLGLETNIADGAPALVKASPTLLREMVVNLVDNALRYTRAGGIVTVLTERGETELRLAVQDNGPGIAAEERDLVFERFYRVLGTGTEGNGLGLAIVREIVTGADGRVRLLDGPDGKGITVEVFLPISDDA